MEIVFLGTNGWYDTSTGNTVCILLNTKDYTILLDAGNGIYKADRYMDPSRPAYMFLSHFHLDHIAGLHILNKLQFNKGLKIYGQPGTTEILDKVANHPFTLPLSNEPFCVEVLELCEGRHNLPFGLECRYLLHASSCMGYRVEIDGKVISYCLDTGLCQAAVDISRGSDLLIAECSLRSGETSPEWPHLNPQMAMELSIRAEAKRLALTHFDAARYTTLEDRLAINQIGPEFRDVIVSMDGMSVEL